MLKSSRRQFIGTGALGLLAFVVGEKTVWLTPAQAKANKLTHGSLNPHQVQAIERLGELLVPGASASGLSHFLDQQLSSASEASLLIIRYLGVEAPYSNFYAKSLEALDNCSRHQHSKSFVDLSNAQADSLVEAMAKADPPGWQGPPAPLFFFVLRNDACDVVYGTEPGFANLGVPYMAHIKPPTRW